MRILSVVEERADVGTSAHRNEGPSYGGMTNGASGVTGAIDRNEHPLNGMVPRKVTVDQAKKIMVSPVGYHCKVSVADVS